MLLAPFHLLYKYVSRERIRSGSRSSRKPPKQKYVYICLFRLDGFSDLLHCAASPAALWAQEGKWGGWRGGQSSWLGVELWASSVGLLTYLLNCRPWTTLWGCVQESSGKGPSPGPPGFPFSGVKAVLQNPAIHNRCGGWEMGVEQAGSPGLCCRAPLPRSAASLYIVHQLG